MIIKSKDLKVGDVFHDPLIQTAIAYEVVGITDGIYCIEVGEISKTMMLLNIDEVFLSKQTVWNREMREICLNVT